MQRLQAEIKITKAKLIVVDGPITMHLDPQIGNYEARSLFRRTIDLLKQIAEENDVGIVLITSSKVHSRRHSHLLTMVKNRCQASLLGKEDGFKVRIKCGFFTCLLGLLGTEKKSRRNRRFMNQ